MPCNYTINFFSFALLIIQLSTMKTLLLTLFLFTVSKYSVAQQATLGVNYFPNEIFDSENARIEGGFYFGDFLKYGAFLRADDDFSELSCGLGLSTTVLKLGETCELDLNTAIGFDFKQQDETKFTTDYHRNYAEVSASLVYKIAENYYLKQVFGKQYFSQSPVTYFGASVIYRLK